MLRRTVLACTVLISALGSSAVRAQIPYPSDLVPTRSALSRLGLERAWMAIVPLVADERVKLISHADDMIFVQTNLAHFHVYDAETGRPRWSVRLGSQTAKPRPASVNSFAVFVTSMNKLYALDRATGRVLWIHELGPLPSSSTACDEDRVFVGLADGRMYGYNLKVKNEKTNESKISDRPVPLWNWQTGGFVETRPLPAMKLVAFGSDDGKAYVSLSEERTMLYRIATGGPIGVGLGSLGPRLLLIPSGDNNLYGVDLLTAQVLWSFASGAPINQEPFVADNDVFIVNRAGHMSSIDPATGSPKWTTSTQGGQILAVGEKRVYLESHDSDLFIVDRATGQIVADPRATLERAGLNLRAYDLGVMNRENDRLYFATTSGMVICLREIGAVKPRLNRDPKALPFGYIPREGVRLTPLGVPAPPPGQAAPGGEAKPEDGEKPAEPKGAEPKGDEPKADEPK
jgi:outer membrane protein assembly factor BamB